MKRRALLGHLQEHGCVPVREGGNYSIWANPQTGRKEAIPRHSEIKNFLHVPFAAKEHKGRKISGENADF